MLTNSFEGGLDGEAISPADSGALSGSAFDAVNSGGSGQVLFSSAAAIHGSLGAAITLSGNNQSVVQWIGSFGSPASFWARGYFNLGSIPAQLTRIFEVQNASGASQWSVAIDPTGKIGIRNSSVGVYPPGGLSGSTLTPGQNCRFELSAVFSGSTWTVVLQVYLGSNAEGTTPDILLTPSTMTSLSGGAQYLFGAHSSLAQTWALSIDDIALSADGPIGPYQPFVAGFSRARVRVIPRLRRGAFFGSQGFGQAAQGVQFPLYRRQPSYLPKWAPYIRRSRIRAPLPPQATQGVQFPLVTRQPGYFPRWYPSLRRQRGRVFPVIPSQATQGVQFPLFTRSGDHSLHRFAPRLARSRWFQQPFPQVPQGLPFNLFTRQAGRLRWLPATRLLRGRAFGPRFAQKGQGTQFPLFTRRSDGARLRFARIWRSPRIRQWIVSKTTAQGVAHFTGASTLTVGPVVTEKAAASLTATGTLLATGIVTRPASSALSATATLRASSTANRIAIAPFTGNSALTVSATVLKLAASSLSATGTMTVSGQDQPGAALRATASLSASAVAGAMAAAALSGTSQMLASASVASPVQEILIPPAAIAPWDEVVEDGTWQQQAPVTGPSVITTEATIMGTYDDE